MGFSKGKFETELNEIEKLLRKIDFFEERNYYPNNDLDAAIYRSKKYIENWKSLISDNIYNFILTDNSIFKFYLSPSESKISFTFYECPYICLSYKDYLTSNDLEEDFENKMFLDYYEVYVHQCEIKENPVMVRYDLDYNSYLEGLHPVSHIHIGHKNQIRIVLKKILSPKSFVSFIFRQNYPAHWKLISSSKNEWKNYFIKEKLTLLEIKDSHWNELDHSEFHLS